MRTPEQAHADRVKASRAAAAARSAKKIPTCTIRVPITLKERMEGLLKPSETLAGLISRALLELE